MKTIKFRIIEKPSKATFYIQTRKFFMWHYKTIRPPAMEAAPVPRPFMSKDSAIKQILDDSSYKNSKIKLVEYPTLIISFGYLYK